MLDEAALKAVLVDIATNHPTTHDEAGQRWAAAYGSAYAAAGRSRTGNAPNVTAAVKTLTRALSTAFATNDAAPLMEAAFVAFWSAPPMPFPGPTPPVAGPHPGVVTLVGSPPDLAGVFRRNVDIAASAEDACGAIAAALHAFTKTVVVTDATTPSPTIGTIT